MNACSAEAVHGIRNRLSARPADFGLNDHWLSATVDHAVARQFCLAQLPAARVAELGQLVRAQDGVTGAYLLDDHHEMMRDTFRRVAEEVVMPLAEEIHRHDLDIPAAIIDQVKELVVHEMIHAIQLDVPVEVDASIGPNWLETD